MTGPFVPPCRFFADAAHHAAFLALLDAEDRVRAAAAAIGEARHWYVAWALLATAKVPAYLGESRARLPRALGRPEYAAGALLARAVLLEREARALAGPSAPPRFFALLLAPTEAMP